MNKRTRLALTSLVALSAGASAQVLPTFECTVPCATTPIAGKAWCNTPNAPAKDAAYDFIPTDGSGNGFYVVYSHRQVGGPVSLPTPTNVGIFMIELDPGQGGRDQVLIFGAGYGDLAGLEVWEGIATHGGRCDARFVDHVIQNEMGFVPGNTTVQFVAPHGHYDHINPDLPHYLHNLNYGIGDIYYHEADWDLVDDEGSSSCSTARCPIAYQPYVLSLLPEIKDMNWSGSSESSNGTTIFNECAIDLDPKLEELTSEQFENLCFPSPLGFVHFVPVAGHTCGSVDLILEVTNVPLSSNFVRVLGSNVVCQPPMWASPMLYDDDLITAHGNILLPDLFSLGCP